jgi:exodeoxyribonuclease V alpha subunit
MPAGFVGATAPLVTSLPLEAVIPASSGFKSADQIAVRLGIVKTAMIHFRAGIAFALAEASDEGHCGLLAEELRALAELLEIPAEMVDTALALELAEAAVVADTVEGRSCVFLAGGGSGAGESLSGRLLSEDILQAGPIRWEWIRLRAAG